MLGYRVFPTNLSFVGNIYPAFKCLGPFKTKTGLAVIVSLTYVTCQAIHHSARTKLTLVYGVPARQGRMQAASKAVSVGDRVRFIELDPAKKYQWRQLVIY